MRVPWQMRPVLSELPVLLEADGACPGVPSRVRDARIERAVGTEIPGKYALMAEYPKIPEMVEPESSETPAYSEAWPQEVLRTLGVILAVLQDMRKVLAERPEPPVEKEPAARAIELPDGGEPLGTWILEDARVAAIEEAIVQEQRVRGQAYGG